MGCVQRLVTNAAVADASIPTILTMLGDVAALGVEIQLKILQVLLPLLSNYPNIHDQKLAQALQLCFRLHDSKIAVVNNTAAATLRQLVILVFEKVAKQPASSPVTSPPLPEAATETAVSSPNSTVQDAVNVFTDLCLLTGDTTPTFIQISGLARTFGLELLESILTYHYSVFHTHSALAILLKKHLCPAVIKLFSEATDFPSIMRLMRLFFISFKRLRLLIPIECEIYFSMMVKYLEPDHPMWHRVLTMEVFRGMCADSSLLRFLYQEYDQRAKAKPVYQDMIAAIARIATEKPASIGIATASAAAHDGTNAAPAPLSPADLAHAEPTDTSVLSGTSAMLKIQCLDQLDKVDPPTMPDAYLFYLCLVSLAAVAESMANAGLPLITASQTIPSHASQSLTSPKSPTKTTSPNKPTDGACTSGVVVSVLNPAIDWATHPKAAILTIIRDMAQASWPGFLAAFSFYLTTRLDDVLFRRLMAAIQALIKLCGAFGLDTPRDAFLTSLCKHCLPLNVDKYHAIGESRRLSVSASPSMRTASFSSDTTLPPTKLPTAAKSSGSGASSTLNSIVTTLAAGKSHAPPRGVIPISQRNMACLQVLFHLAHYLGSSLGNAWYMVLLTLQQASELLPSPGPLIQCHGTREGSMVGSLASRQNSISSVDRRLMTDSDRNARTLTGSIRDKDLLAFYDSCHGLFDHAIAFPSTALLAYVRALCCLSCELSQIPFPACDATACQQMLEQGGVHRKVAVTERPSFALQYMNYLVVYNLSTLLQDDITQKSSTSGTPPTPFGLIMAHLIDMATSPTAPSTHRLQGCEAIAEVAEVALTAIDWSTVGVLEANHIQAIQCRVLTPLAQVVLPTVDPSARTSERTQAAVASPNQPEPTTPPAMESVAVPSWPTGFQEVPQLALETLNRILHSAGHSMASEAWTVAFGMLALGNDLPMGWADVDSAEYALNNTVEHFIRQVAYESVANASVFSATPFNTNPQFTGLVRHAFGCLQLICTDFLAILPTQCLARCIHLLGCFGRQRNDVNVALTAIGLFWNISDYLQARHTATESASASEVLPAAKAPPNRLLAEPTLANELHPSLRAKFWMLLLQRLALLCVDPRPEVRHGANRTLYRTLDLNGQALTPANWQSVFWYILFPTAKAILRCRQGPSEPEATDAWGCLNATDLCVRVGDDTTLELSTELDLGKAITKPALSPPLQTTANDVEATTATSTKAWDETVALTATGLCKVVHTYCLIPVVANHNTGTPLGNSTTAELTQSLAFQFYPIWRWALGYIETCFTALADNKLGMEFATVGLQCLRTLLTVTDVAFPITVSSNSASFAMVWPWWQCAWQTWITIGSILVGAPDVRLPALPDHESLVSLAWVDEAHLLVLNQSAPRFEVSPRNPDAKTDGMANIGCTQDILASHLELVFTLFTFPVLDAATLTLNVAASRVIDLVLVHPRTHLTPLLAVTKAVVFCEHAPLHAPDEHQLSLTQAVAVRIWRAMSDQLSQPANDPRQQTAYDSAIAELLIDWLNYLAAPCAAADPFVLGHVDESWTPSFVSTLLATDPPPASPQQQCLRHFAQLQQRLYPDLFPATFDPAPTPGSPTTNQPRRQAQLVRSDAKYSRKTYAPTYVALAVAVLRRMLTSLTTDAAPYLPHLLASDTILQITATFRFLMMLQTVLKAPMTVNNPPFALNLFDTTVPGQAASTVGAIPFSRLLAWAVLTITNCILPFFPQLPEPAIPSYVAKVWAELFTTASTYLFGASAMDNAAIGHETLSIAVMTIPPPLSQRPKGQALASFDIQWLVVFLQSTLKHCSGSQCLTAREYASLVQLLWRGATLFPTTADDMGPALPSEPISVERELLAWTCLGFLFMLSDPHPTEFPDAAPQALAGQATAALITHSRARLQAYVADLPSLGKCPMPRLREEELSFLLSRLSVLELRDDVDLPAMPLASPLSSPKVQANRHLLLLYPYLCQAVLSSSPRIVPLIHQCLDRVGQTWLPPNA
ncbi:Endocytosis and vacuole integrity protein [Dimargaris verticillata]|uniref:Endocytosis and vacuole integrity protein n=1 Tax=Dimargaris verticillata TaxID=2761393 RepID=A0A9W8E9H1_9FUNG|nr:Endocytosis and vacuole integrity protein [Dimargaris verticillata]